MPTTTVSKLLLAFMCMVLLVVPALMPASSAMGADHEITLASNPQVTVNLTKVVNVNVSFAFVSQMIIGLHLIVDELVCVLRSPDCLNQHYIEGDGGSTEDTRNIEYHAE